MTVDEALEILQVRENAEPEVVQAAYKRLAAKYHPDRNRSPDAHQHLVSINAAYALLKNSDHRKADHRNAERAKRKPSSPDPLEASTEAPNFQLSSRTILLGSVAFIPLLLAGWWAIPIIGGLILTVRYRRIVGRTLIVTGCFAAAITIPCLLRPYFTAARSAEAERPHEYDVRIRSELTSPSGLVIPIPDGYESMPAAAPGSHAFSRRLAQAQIHLSVRTLDTFSYRFDQFLTDAATGELAFDSAEKLVLELLPADLEHRQDVRIAPLGMNRELKAVGVEVRSHVDAPASLLLAMDDASPEWQRLQASGVDARMNRCFLSLGMHLAKEDQLSAFPNLAAVHCRTNTDVVHRYMRVLGPTFFAPRELVERFLLRPSDRTLIRFETTPLGTRELLTDWNTIWANLHVERSSSPVVERVNMVSWVITFLVSALTYCLLSFGFIWIARKLNWSPLLGASVFQTLAAFLAIATANNEFPAEDVTQPQLAILAGCLLVFPLVMYRMRRPHPQG